jgi:hypothetical protein
VATYPGWEEIANLILHVTAAAERGAAHATYDAQDERDDRERAMAMIRTGKSSGMPR